MNKDSFIKALANGHHSWMTDGEHRNAYEEGDRCEECIAWAEEVAPFISPMIEDFVAEWITERYRHTFGHDIVDAWREERLGKVHNLDIHGEGVSGLDQKGLAGRDQERGQEDPAENGEGVGMIIGPETTQRMVSLLREAIRIGWDAGYDPKDIEAFLQTALSTYAKFSPQNYPPDDIERS